MFNQVKKIFKYIINAKLVFEVPKKSNILIYDRNRSNLIIESLQIKHNVIVLDIRGESFNILILFINLLKFKFTLRSYIETYINFSNPKFVVTLRDNDIGFFKLNLKKSKKILIQQSWKTIYDDEFLKNLDKNENKTKNKIDHVFCFNKNIENKYKLAVDGTFQVIGSLKSNFVLSKKYIHKKYDVTYISGGNLNQINHTHPKLIKLTVNILKYLSFFCKKKKLKLFVYGKANDYLDEKHFYDKKLGKLNYTFVPNYKINPLVVTDKSKLVITFNSTLGYESFSRGNKTIFLNCRQFLHCKSLKFGWPKNFLNEGPFWTSKVDFQNISSLLYKVYNMNDLQWKMIVEKYSADLIFKDQNNQKLKNLIS